MDRKGFDRLGDPDCPTCKQLPILWLFGSVRSRYYGSFGSLVSRSHSLPPERPLNRLSPVGT